MCADDKRLASSEISAESRALAGQMLRAPVESFAAMPGRKTQAADLRKFLLQALQRHMEKKTGDSGDAGENQQLAFSMLEILVSTGRYATAKSSITIL